MRCRLILNTEVVALHDFSRAGAPVTAWRARITGEHITPTWAGPRREVRADAEADAAFA